MNKVYITNIGGHDFKPAKRFGEIIAITKGNINPVQTDRLMIDMLEILKDSTENDYLLLSGHPVIILIAGCIMFTLHKKIKLLVWNKHKSAYDVREVSIRQIEETIKMVFERG